MSFGSVKDCDRCDGSGETRGGGICGRCHGAGFRRTASDDDFEDIAPDDDGPMPNDGGRDEP